ncbi:MAG: N-acetylmuramoyl-L-alanine amidase [Chloroflexota bacterium]
MQRLREDSELGWFFRRNLAVFLFLAIATGGLIYIYRSFDPDESRPFTVQDAADGESGASNNDSNPIYNQAAFGNVTQQFAQSPGPLRLAIVVGHGGSDPGAVCDDGLTEVQINENIAVQALAILEDAGYPVSLFGEFDPRLDGFSSDVVISLHSDSCTPLDASFTGFKTTVNQSLEADRLKNCVEQNYAAMTGLPIHAATITNDMTHYHAFNKISAESPALLLEMGFMYNDRELLTTYSDLVARGVANGILCFMNGQP